MKSVVACGAVGATCGEAKLTHCGPFCENKPLCQINARRSFHDFPCAVYTLSEVSGGWAVGPACPHLSANPRTHGVQDLNSLACFRGYWNRDIWRFFFPMVCEDQVFSVIPGWE